MKKVWLYIGLAIAIAAGVISWLMFGGKRPIEVDLNRGISAKFNATLKDTEVRREKDGKVLWEFQVAEVEKDQILRRTLLRGIQGKVYRQDGSYLTVSARQGEMKDNSQNFMLTENVTAVYSADGARMFADKVVWQQNQEKVTAIGNVKFWKNEWFVSADKAESSGSFDKVHLFGHAWVEKKDGGGQ